MRKNLIKIM
uniref:Uncharacterized protein n=1 Tax=Rhizophora mucronata TaxID=61149 RepID=A0A2P2PIH0_RHIMU